MPFGGKFFVGAEM
jgi:hypothetical protein